jgi:hypothetical protein
MNTSNEDIGVIPHLRLSVCYERSDGNGYFGGCKMLPALYMLVYKVALSSQI